MPKKGKRPVVGVQLPKQSNGKRSSTPFNKAVWMAAAKAVDSEAAKRFVASVEKEKNWRWGYMKYVEESMRLASKPEDCVKMATAAWKFVYDSLEYFSEEGATPISIAQAMENPNKLAAFETGEIKGGAKVETEWSLPVEGKVLKGTQAAAQISAWKAKGVIESDTAEALMGFCRDSSFISGLSNKIFVLLGGLSEMGPLQRLLSFGATVVALDYHAKPLQERLLKIASQYSGTLILPLKTGTSSLPQEKWAENAGCDLLTNFPEVADWLVGLHPNKEMIIGSFCYLDGELFIKIVSTMDAICQTVTARRKTPTGLCYYATPTDCHIVTPEAVSASTKQSHSALATILSVMCKPGYNNKNIVNGLQFTNSLVDRQGPNYCLAKRLQTYRAIVGRANGHNVSLNVAPTTKTVSVMKNAMFAFTMQGFSSFSPMYPFETETTKSVMTALMIYDFINPKSSANASTNVGHPLQLIQKTQVHGGMYRTGLLFNSMGTPAAIVAILQKYGWILVLILLLLVGFNFYM